VASRDSAGERRRYLPLYDQPGFRPNPPYVVGGEPWTPWRIARVIAALIVLDIISFGPSAWMLCALIAVASKLSRS
jgi:hypothetical protein